MFNFDPSIILLCFVVCPITALASLMTLTTRSYDQLPDRQWLTWLPGYRFMYRKSFVGGDTPERSVRATVIGLGCLYLSILVFFAPFANKFLGMSAWLLSVPAYQAMLVVLFDLCIIATCGFLFTGLKGLRARSNAPYRFLPLVGLSILLGAGATYAMSTDVRLVVLLASKTTLAGLVGFLFFGALLFAVNQEESETATGEVGSRFVNIILILLSVGSLMSVVS